MRRLGNMFGVAAVAGSVLLASVARGADEKDEAKKIAPGDVPQKVSDSIKGRFPGAKVSGVEREKEEGNIIYDVELTQDGRKYEMDIKEDGTIVEIEKALDAADRPANITKAVMQKWPKATVKEVMEKSLVKDGKETVHEYEVVLATPDGTEQEVTVSKDGKITEEAKGEDEKKDKDDDKDKKGEK